VIEVDEGMRLMTDAPGVRRRQCRCTAGLKNLPARAEGRPRRRLIYVGVYEPTMRKLVGILAPQFWFAFVILPLPESSPLPSHLEETAVVTSRASGRRAPLGSAAYPGCPEPGNYLCLRASHDLRDLHTCLSPLPAHNDLKLT
jgi:hypothetical protein